MEAVSSAAHPPPKWMSGSTQPRGSLLHKKLIEQNLLLLRMLPWMQNVSAIHCLVLVVEVLNLKCPQI